MDFTLPCYTEVISCVPGSRRRAATRTLFSIKNYKSDYFLFKYHNYLVCDWLSVRVVLLEKDLIGQP